MGHNIIIIPIFSETEFPRSGVSPSGVNINDFEVNL